MDRRAVASVALLAVVAFVTVGADSCGAADRDEPPAGQAAAEPAAPAADPSSDPLYAVESAAPPVPDPTPSSAGPTRSPAPTAAPTPDFSGEEVTLFSNSNDGVIRDGATGPATLVLDAPTLITYVQTYHWHGGQGVPPGAISITSPDGTVYGPWQASGTDGQGGVKNAYWEVRPRVELPPGTYLVDDSDPATRGTNEAMGGIGQTIVRGVVAAP